MTKFFAQVFFGLVRLFFANFLNVSKGSPFFFSYFAKKMFVQKLPKAPFYIFRHYVTYRRLQKNRFFFNFYLLRGALEENTLTL